jgi:simple sugar transport system ATP-binding protein
MNNAQPAVRMCGIMKSFGSVTANVGVSLDINRGEILALLGENGSGKTTLMNMLSGIYYPDAGHIFVEGREVSIRSPKDAYDLGIGMIHQHFKLVDVLTAAENIILGMKGEGRLDMKAVHEKINKICSLYGFDVNPERKIYDMSVSQKQTVEIVKVLYRGADILILDEPTAVLTPQETDKLFAVLRNMRKDGKAIVIITHKLHEVEDISDRVVILRRGENVGDKATKDLNASEMTNMMVGRPVSLNIDRPETQNQQLRLRVEGLTVFDSDGIAKLSDVSFDLNSGEILGIAGISGCGQKELLESIAGLQPIKSGSIRYFEPKTGREIDLRGKNASSIFDLGVALSFVPEDRLGMGLVGNMNLTDNMMLRSYRYGKSMLLDRKTPGELAKRVVDELAVITPGISTPVRRLSGGNVQKILVGREIASAPTVLMTAYAVRGLDINSSYTIYDLLNRQKEAGVAVMFVGEDLDVLLELCDRILVLCGGKVSGIVSGRGADKRAIGMMMTKLGGEQKNESKS